MARSETHRICQDVPGIRLDIRIVSNRIRKGVSSSWLKDARAKASTFYEIVFATFTFLSAPS